MVGTVKYKLLSLAVVLFWSLCFTANTHAIMQTEKAKELAEEAPAGEGETEITPEKAKDPVKARIIEEIEKTKKEKQKIIEAEKAKEEKKPQRLRPFESEIKFGDKDMASKLIPEKIDFFEKQTALLGEKPVEILVFLFAIALALYLTYRVMIKRLNKQRPDK